MASFIDNTGALQQISLDATIYREASDAQLSVEALINQKYATKAGEPTAFEQACASEGMFLSADRKFGLRPATMEAILNGTKIEAGGNTVVRDAVPASRILFPAVYMSVLENKLVTDNSGTIAAFDSMVAVDDSINHDRYERPILDYSRPEGARSKAIAQLSEPTSMLSITASDKAFRITGTSVGMEISDEAMRSTSLDLVTMAMTRQAMVEKAERVDLFIANFLNGDADVSMAAMPVGNIATASTFDGAAVAAGTLTQKAWVKFLFNNAKKRTITHVITDINGALAIQNRTGRPVITTDNGTSKRLDAVESVINPLLPDQVQVFITTDPNWPANTIMGFDKRYGIHRVTSTSLAYQAAEAYAMRRSHKFRIDMGQIAYRLFDDAWNVMTLT